MIIRSFCIWIVLFFLLVFIMNPITSRSAAHRQRLIELEKDIAEIKDAYGLEKKLKSELIKQREELSKKIEAEIKRGESAKRLFK